MVVNIKTKAHLKCRVERSKRALGSFIYLTTTAVNYSSKDCCEYYQVAISNKNKQVGFVYLGAVHHSIHQSVINASHTDEKFPYSKHTAMKLHISFYLSFSLTNSNIKDTPFPHLQTQPSNFHA